MADMDYSFGSGDVSPSGPENRADYRLTARAVAVLELESGTPGVAGGKAIPARKLECRIRDLSASGLCVLSTEPLTAGALVPAQVSLSAATEAYSLMVEIVWCRPEAAGFLSGIRILESDDTACVEWLEAVARALAPS